MQRVEFSYSMKIEFSAPVVRHCFSVRCLPPDSPQQRICELFLEVSPHNVLTETADGFGNRILTDRITEPHTLFSVYVNGIAELDLSAREPEPLNGIYKYPSQQAFCGARLAALAEAQKPLCEGLAPVETAKRLMAALRAQFVYKGGVTNVATTAGETHAWAEVYDGGYWVGVDPTNDKLVDERYLKLSHGRDFADCGINRGLFVGGGTQKQTIEATVRVL